MADDWKYAVEDFEDDDDTGEGRATDEELERTVRRCLSLLSG